MPKAEADTGSITHYDLRTAPPDGYVKLRRLSFGEFMARRQMTSAMRISGGRGSEFQGEMDLANQAAVEYEFAHCIVEHNLERADGKPFDFRKPADIKRLDPRIGQEISEYIDEMNQLLENDDEDETSVKDESEQPS